MLRSKLKSNETFHFNVLFLANRFQRVRDHAQYRRTYAQKIFELIENYDTCHQFIHENMMRIEMVTVNFPLPEQFGRVTQCLSQHVRMLVLQC